MYSTEVCPTNSANRLASQFTVSNIVYKIFVATSKDSHSDICKYSYIRVHPVERRIISE